MEAEPSKENAESPRYGRYLRTASLVLAAVLLPFAVATAQQSDSTKAADKQFSTNLKALARSYNNSEANGIGMGADASLQVSSDLKAKASFTEVRESGVTKPQEWSVSIIKTLGRLSFNSWVFHDLFVGNSRLYYSEMIGLKTSESGSGPSTLSAGGYVSPHDYYLVLSYELPSEAGTLKPAIVFGGWNPKTNSASGPIQASALILQETQKVGNVSVSEKAKWAVPLRGENNFSRTTLKAEAVVSVPIK